MTRMWKKPEAQPLSTPVVLLYKSANRPADATARVVHELADALRANGLAAIVHGMDNRTHPHRFKPSEGGVRARAGYWIGKTRDQIAEGVFLLRTSRALTKCSDDPQVVISVDYPTGVGLTPVVARILGRRNMHTISWVMDDYQDQKLARSPFAIEARVRRFIDRLALRKADVVVTIGRCMAEHIARHTRRQATVIPLWAHAPDGMPDPDAVARVRESWGADNNTTVFLYSGHAAPHHPLEALVSAAGLVKDRSDIKFVVSGVGLELERLRNSPLPAALANWQFGRQVASDEVDAMLAAGDVHVVSLAENVTGTCVPSKTYAALARGKAVLYLGSGRGQAGHDVLESQAGYVVPTDDPAAISTAILRLADADSRDRMGRAAHSWALTHARSSTVVQEWLGLVQRLLTLDTRVSDR